MAGRCCYVCGKRQPRRGKSTITLHKFPKDSETCTKWRQFCKLVDTDCISANIRLCSDHFTPESYIDYNSKKFGGILKLKPTAVPSEWEKCKRPKFTEVYVTSLPTSTTETLTDSSTSSLVNVSLFPPESKNVVSSISQPATSISEDSDLLEEKYDISNSTNIKPPVCDAIVQTNLTLLNIKNIITYEEQLDAQFPPVEVIQEEAGPSMPKTPRYVEPRYIGDITPFHLSTPKRAKIAFQVARHTCTKQNEQIKKLHGENRRLKKKIAILNGLIRF